MLLQYTLDYRTPMNMLHPMLFAVFAGLISFNIMYRLSARPHFTQVYRSVCLFKGTSLVIQDVQGLRTGSLLKSMMASCTYLCVYIHAGPKREPERRQECILIHALDPCRCTLRDAIGDLWSRWPVIDFNGLPVRNTPVRPGGLKMALCTGVGINTPV